MLVDLIRGDREPSSGLHSYVRHMMAVLVFDAERRGRLISAIDLARYTDHLATAVTDALQYFIGHGQAIPDSESRYSARPLGSPYRAFVARYVWKTLRRAITTFPRKSLRLIALIPGT